MYIMYPIMGRTWPEDCFVLQHLDRAHTLLGRSYISNVIFFLEFVVPLRNHP